MRLTAFAGLFAFAIIAANGSKVSAEPLTILQIETPLKVAVIEPTLFEQLKSTSDAAVVTPPPVAVPEPVKYTVVLNDSLIKIAEAHNTTWKRLYDKNESIAIPDKLVVGMELIIPAADEVIQERAVPQTPQPTYVAAAPRTNSSARVSTPAHGSSAGNKYIPGYCTWYVKNKRPDMPNNLGNADTWVARAAAQGLATGGTPRVGAVGQAGMHVVYVEAVNGDGTVTISEMNHTGLYVVTTRTLPASSFSYIY
jgi:surface antigen